MSKLSYPSDGIYKYVREYIESCSNNLSKAISNCDFDIPSGFTYKSYLSGLSGVISDYHKEISSIDSKLQKSNNNYENLSSDLSSSTEKFVDIKIKERDRMIV